MKLQHECLRFTRIDLATVRRRLGRNVVKVANVINLRGSILGGMATAPILLFKQTSIALRVINLLGSKTRTSFNPARPLSLPHSTAAPGHLY